MLGDEVGLAKVGGAVLSQLTPQHVLVQCSSVTAESQQLFTSHSELGSVSGVHDGELVGIGVGLFVGLGIVGDTVSPQYTPQHVCWQLKAYKIFSFGLQQLDRVQFDTTSALHEGENVGEKVGCEFGVDVG